MANLVFYTAPVDQGQIVEVSYAMTDDGHVICRVFDAGDRTTEYSISQALVSDRGDYWNGPPENKRWRKITKAEVDDYNGVSY